MTDDDTTAIATGLALSSGISDMVFLLEPELAALDRTVTAGAPMLETLTQLGVGLNAFNANAAPIAASPLAQQSHDASVGQSESGVPEHAAARAEYRTTALSTSGTRVLRDQAATPLTQHQPGSAGQPAVRRVSPPAAVMMSRAVPTTAKPEVADGLGSPIAPTAPTHIQESTSRSQSIAPLTLTPDTADTIRSLSPDAGAQPVATAPSDAAAEIGGPVKQRQQQVVIGVVAPRRAANLPPQAAPIPLSAPSPDGTTSDTPQPRVPTASAAVSPSEPQRVPSFSEPPQTETEQKQGTMVLDGTVLGRWMIDHLERHASRPGVMTTGIDPRMSATYPGAPTGA